MSGFIFQCFYDIVCHIPAGTVATYGQVARLAGMPRCARTVGYAMAANRDPSVPCHRVVDRFGGTKSCFDLYGPGTQRALLEAEGLSAEVVLDSHANLEQYAEPGTVDCVVFNFGRLPGGDPSIFTRSVTSVAALEAALRLLKPGGVIAIALYYGGANGYGERDAVMTWLETLDDRKFSVLRCDWANRRNDPPMPVFIWNR